jgi:hypothetical protein
LRVLSARVRGNHALTATIIQTAQNGNTTRHCQGLLLSFVGKGIKAANNI